MKTLTKILLLSAALLGCYSRAKVITKTVNYKLDGKILEGFLAYDDSKAAKLPGVLVVHEWTGLGSFVKNRAEELARMGYVAFAADIYGKGVRPNVKEAGKISSIYKNNKGLMRARAFAGLKELRKQPMVDSKKVAAIGYCFGGTTVLELVRGGAEIAGVVSFHGGLSQGPSIETEVSKAKILVLHGADDPHVPPAEVAAFEQEMTINQMDWQLTKYSGAVHAFTNPEAGNDNSKGAAYNKLADQRSWTAMKSFFDEIFDQPKKI